MSEAKKTVAYAMSSGVVALPMGICLVSISRMACLSGALMKLVGDGPGATQLTRMPDLASTVASCLVNKAMAALDMAYIPTPWLYMFMLPEPMLTMTPYFRFFIYGR